MVLNQSIALIGFMYLFFWGGGLVYYFGFIVSILWLQPLFYVAFLGTI